MYHGMHQEARGKWSQLSSPFCELQCLNLSSRVFRANILFAESFHQSHKQNFFFKMTVATCSVKFEISGKFLSSTDLKLPSV